MENELRCPCCGQFGAEKVTDCWVCVPDDSIDPLEWEDVEPSAEELRQNWLDSLEDEIAP